MGHQSVAIVTEAKPAQRLNEPEGTTPTRSFQQPRKREPKAADEYRSIAAASQRIPTFRLMKQPTGMSSTERAIVRQSCDYPTGALNDFWSCASK
jgi:hypothetical protein